MRHGIFVGNRKGARKKKGGSGMDALAQMGKYDKGRKKEKLTEEGKI